MTILGKLLLFVNLLAAGGFVYLATQDWRGRQTINAAALKHILLLRGLPLDTDPKADSATDPDEVPFDVEMAGGYRTKTVSKKLLDSYLKSAPGGPLGGGMVPNQLAEVKQAKQKLDAALAEQPALLSNVLLAQAETLKERQEIQKLIADRKDAELKERLDAKFAAVTENTTPPQSAEGRRVRIAHLLVHLSPDEAWQKRVMAVVGMRKYVAAIATQAVRFREMAAAVDEFLLTDQAAYIAHELQFRQQAIDDTNRVNHQAEIKKNLIAEKVKEDDLFGQRGTQLKEIAAQLAKTKAEVDDLLTKQTAIEASLFEIQRDIAITLDLVYQLEMELESRERFLLGRQK